MHDNARGGNDTLIGGAGANNELYGDANSLHDNARGGDDTLIGGGGGGVINRNSPSNDLFGDAQFMDGDSRGGNDTLIGGAGPGGPSSFMFLYGDASEMHDNARGGNDHLTGGTGIGTQSLYGDAGIIDGDGRGGDDTIIGGGASVDLIYGDASRLSDNARGGDDILTGGVSSFTINVIHGDAGDMDGDSRGGNDTLIGPGLLFGDAEIMRDNARGGNDTLIGGDGSSSTLYGDAGGAGVPPTFARGMVGDSRGGNDTLTGGNGGVNFLYGDAFSMSDNARGGNDTLISGTGTDHMWGDAEIINGLEASPTADSGTVKTGADTFAFAPGNGNDDIGDFRQSDHDRIDVSAYGFHNLAQMMITFTGDTTIAFDANNSVTLWALRVPCTSRISCRVPRRSRRQNMSGVMTFCGRVEQRGAHRFRGFDARVIPLLGVRSRMRGDDKAAFEPGLARAVGAQQFRHRLDRRLDRQHVEPDAGEMPALQRRQQRVEIEDRPARGVDHHPPCGMRSGMARRSCRVSPASAAHGSITCRSAPAAPRAGGSGRCREPARRRSAYRGHKT